MSDGTTGYIAMIALLFATPCVVGWAFGAVSFRLYRRRVRRGVQAGMTISEAISAAKKARGQWCRPDFTQTDVDLLRLAANYWSNMEPDAEDKDAARDVQTWRVMGVQYGALADRIAALLPPRDRP